MWNKRASSARRYRLTRMNVGLETASSEPHPCATPCTNVVLPAPRSPCRHFTSPACSARPKCVPIRRVCSGLRLKKSIVCSFRIDIGRIISGGWILPQDGSEAGRKQVHRTLLATCVLSTCVPATYVPAACLRQPCFRLRYTKAHKGERQ